MYRNGCTKSERRKPAVKEIIKKISYLRGLCEGSGFGEDTKEGAVFAGILDVLDDMAEILEAFEYDDECEDECDDGEEYTYAFICPACGQELEVDEDILENEEELTCPACGNIIPVVNEFADFDDDEE